MKITEKLLRYFSENKRNSLFGILQTHGCQGFSGFTQAHEYQGLTETPKNRKLEDYLNSCKPANTKG